MNSLSAFQATLSPQLHVRYDSPTHALWVRWKPAPCCNFNIALLNDLKLFADFIEGSQGLITDERNCSQPVDYILFASDTPGIFQLGGDLAHFAHAITQRNEPCLREYAHRCINLLYRFYYHFNLPVMTISVVQGACLGGGFELALATDWIIAEEHARFAFPEVRHGFLPGMGATSFLDRCLSRSQMDTLLYSGQEFSAAEMEAIGLVSKTAANGKGVEIVKEFIKQQARVRIGSVAVAQARRRVRQLHYEELMDVVELWVDVVMRLTPRDARRLLRIASQQEKKG